MLLGIDKCPFYALLAFLGNCTYFRNGTQASTHHSSARLTLEISRVGNASRGYQNPFSVKILAHLHLFKTVKHSAQVQYFVFIKFNWREIWQLLLYWTNYKAEHCKHIGLTGFEFAPSNLQTECSPT